MRTARFGAPLLVAAGLALSACGSTQSAQHQTSSTAPSIAKAAPAGDHVSAAAAKARARRIRIVPSGAEPRIPTVTGLCPTGLTICVSTAPALQVRGPGSTVDKLVRQLHQSNPTLTPVKLACPGATHAYPFVCDLNGTIGAGASQVEVSGSLRVMGIETVTDLYAYELDYQPIRD